MTEIFKGRKGGKRVWSSSRAVTSTSLLGGLRRVNNGPNKALAGSTTVVQGNEVRKLASASSNGFRPKMAKTFEGTSETTLYVPCSTKGETMTKSTNITALVDTGCHATYLAMDFVRANWLPIYPLDEPYQTMLADGSLSAAPIELFCELELEVNGFSEQMHALIATGQDIDLIIGMDWIVKHGAVLRPWSRTLEVASKIQGSDEADESELVRSRGPMAAYFSRILLGRKWKW